MEIIEIQTLVDITNTKVIRPNQGTQLAYDQNRNFITLLQCIEIRSIVSYNDAPTQSTVDIKGMGFGSNHKGKHAVWTFRIIPDRSGVYQTPDGNIIGALFDDIDRVPIIKNLTETINIDKAIFDCKDTANKNTIITAHLGTI
jgi:hypothetical protein